MIFVYKALWSNIRFSLWSDDKCYKATDVGYSSHIRMQWRILRNGLQNIWTTFYISHHEIDNMCRGSLILPDPDWPPWKPSPLAANYELFQRLTNCLTPDSGIFLGLVSHLWTFKIYRKRELIPEPLPTVLANLFSFFLLTPWYWPTGRGGHQCLVIISCLISRGRCRAGWLPGPLPCWPPGNRALPLVSLFGLWGTSWEVTSKLPISGLRCVFKNPYELHFVF